jgi:hypothetical protein
MHSIFDSVVTKENDHTNLLRNIMERHPRVVESTLSYLVDKRVSAIKAASFQFRTQCSFLGEDGREIPDMLVEGPDFLCLIEAKIDPSLDLTPVQKTGYKGCFGPAGERHLCFLVPNEWKHSKSVDEVRTSLQGTGIEVHKQKYWRELIENLKGTSESLSDAILIEVLGFWKRRFEVVTMSLPEKEFLNTWSGEKYSAFRKLQKNIDQARKLFDARGYETEDDQDDYGFYIKQGRLYDLWIGIWTESTAPLSYGFDAKWPDWRRPNPVPTSPITTKDGSKLWPLGPDTWGDPEKIYAAVKSFLDSQKYD